MADSWVSQMRKGFVEFGILSVVEAEPTYGYAILQRLRDTGALTFTESTLYPALSRLTRDGLVSSYKSPSPDGPPRRYYALTSAGRERLNEMRIYWIALKDALDGLRATKRGRT